MFCAFLLLSMLGGGAIDQSREFVRVKLLGESAAPSERAHMMTYLKRGKIQKNRIQGRALRIKDREFERGIVMPSPGEIHVILAAPAASFEAIVGIDSNDLGYYSNQGRGGVEASVEVAGREVFRSPYLKEGVPGAPVNVNLGGAREFRLKLAAVGEKSKFHQSEWDQADWAMAKVKLADGSTIWLADLPVGPLETAPAVELPFSFRYDGRPSRELLREWVRQARIAPDRRTPHRAHALLFASFEQSGRARRRRRVPRLSRPSSGRSTSRTPAHRTRGILEDIQALDTRFARGGERRSSAAPRLGSRAKPDDYMPLETPLAAKAEKQLATAGGRRTDADLSYFNLEWPGRGVVIARGLAGTVGRAVHARRRRAACASAAGQELTHFRLHAGRGGAHAADGAAVLAGRLDQRAERVAALDDRAQPAAARRQAAIRRSSPEAAAATPSKCRRPTRTTRFAYPEPRTRCTASSSTTGGWTRAGIRSRTAGRTPARGSRIPSASRAASRRFRHWRTQRGIKILVWFEPERVTPGTWLDKNHPEWLLGRPVRDQLLDLGNPEARASG